MLRMTLMLLSQQTALRRVNQSQTPFVLQHKPLAHHKIVAW